MSILQTLWIAVCLCFINTFRPEALGLAVLSHLVTRVAAPLLTAVLGRLALLATLIFVVWAMYTSVHLYGWFAFWLILISHLTFQVERS